VKFESFLSQTGAMVNFQNASLWPSPQSDPVAEPSAVIAKTIDVCS